MNSKTIIAFLGKILIALAIFFGGFSLFSDLSKNNWWWVLVAGVFCVGLFLRTKFRSVR